MLKEHILDIKNMEKIYIECYNIIKEIVNNTIPNDEHKEDLIQDIILDVMIKPPDKIRKMYKKGEIRFFISKMITNNICSKNSPYYYIYKKRKFEDIDNDKDYKEII